MFADHHASEGKNSIDRRATAKRSLIFVLYRIRAPVTRTNFEKGVNFLQKVRQRLAFF
jgi:hypothetical protein